MAQMRAYQRQGEKPKPISPAEFTLLQYMVRYVEEHGGKFKIGSGSVGKPFSKLQHKPLLGHKELVGALSEKLEGDKTLGDLIYNLEQAKLIGGGRTERFGLICAYPITNDGKNLINKYGTDYDKYKKDVWAGNKQ